MKTRKFKSSLGFSLIEILIVMTIIAILSTLMFTAWRNHYAKLQFTNSAQTIVTELYRARSEARRSSKDVTLSWNKENNLLIIKDEENVTIRTITLPIDVVSIETASSEITYLAPYGRVLQDEDQYIRLVDSKNNKKDILIIGVTGKVYQKTL